LKPERVLAEQLTILAQQGFSRVAINGEIIRIDEFDSKKDQK